MLQNKYVGYIVISANGYAKMSKVTDHASVGVGDSIHILRPVGVRDMVIIINYIAWCSFEWNSRRS